MSELKPLLRVLGLGGVATGGGATGDVACAIWAGSMADWLLCDWARTSLGMMEAGRKPSALSGGRTGAGLGAGL